MKILKIEKDKVQVELTKEEIVVLVGSAYHQTDDKLKLRDRVLIELQKLVEDKN